MDWVWFLFGFDGRINRAKLWLALLVILCWMIFIAMLMLGIDRMFGSSLESIQFSINDIFGIVDPAVVRAAIAGLRDGKQTSPAHLVLNFFHAVGTLVFVWAYLATSIKRLHDRDKGALWMLPYFAAPGLYCQFQDRLPDSYFVFPLAFAVFAFLIWGFIDLYCLKGTRWTNRFGASPLPKEQTQPRRAESRTRATSGWDQTGATEFTPYHASGVDLTVARTPPTNS